MKQVLTSLALVLILFTANAQVASEIKIPENGVMNQFSDWKTQEVSFDDGIKLTIEYRVALIKQKAFACTYSLEVKNNSDIKLKVRVKNQYFDGIVKRTFSEEAKETIKPGKTTAFTTIAQGCKKEKGEEQTPYQRCFACGCSFSIYVSK